jgi:hypothetical protein
MKSARLEIRAILNYYALPALVAGLVILLLLVTFRLANWLIDWTTPFDPADWFTFATGFIIVAILLGPYVATVGQLKGVQKIRTNTILNRPAITSKRGRYIWLALIAGTLLFFAAYLLLNRTFMTWLTFGCSLTLMGLTLFYLGWRIGRIEKTAGITIYQTDYTWRFDRQSYIGVFKKP